MQLCHINLSYKLYTPVQEKLLSNVDHKLTDQQKCMLDEELRPKEIQQAVYELNDAKSTGIDSFTAEFYKKFWPLLQDHYVAFINCANRTSFSHSKNTSVISILYQEKGDTDDLKNYRPISLINVDLKILTKALTNRLKKVLPSVIHYTQTAVDDQKIDNTVHMLRDLIQLANIEDLPAAFIFLDQEKAFDRVNHDFLYKTMKAFGSARYILMLPLELKWTDSSVTISLWTGVFTRDAHSAPSCMYS